MRQFLGAVLLMVVSAVAQGEESFTFNLDEIEKKRYEFGGYIEQKVELFRLAHDHPAYALTYPEAPGRPWLLRGTTTLELTGRANLGDFVADARAQGYFQGDQLQHEGEAARLKEGGVRWSGHPGLTVDVGKRVQRWGKGYAWSPAGLIERPKDPTDPTASREGFAMTSVEWTRSLSGPVSTLGIFAAIVPTRNSLNPDFGREEASNPALKTYLLAWDTDLDFVWRAKGARPQAYGLDFSRNLMPAVEVHGEWVRQLNVSHTWVDADGNTSTGRSRDDAWLLGMRYLSTTEITWIAEYYHNDGGYTQEQLSDYYTFIDTSVASGSASSLYRKARNLAQSGYAKSNPGRDYAYLRASVPEPLGWLYGSLSLTGMMSVQDGSWQIQPEVLYTGFANIELRSRIIYLGGGAHSEFTEKTSKWRMETYARWHF